MSKEERENNNLIGGFSLIEMLVVVLIFSILAILSTQSLATSLRGTRKSESIGNVRENIEYTMSIIERSLRTAKDLDCTASSATRLVYKTPDNIEARFECSGTNIASASGTNTVNLIIDTDVEIVNCASGGDTFFTCNQGAGGIPDSVVIQLTAQDIENRGVESARYTSETKILLRNY